MSAAALLAVLAAWQPTAPAAEEAWRFTTAARVVAFADVHGAYDELVELLRATGVVDAGLRWSGGDRHVVSLGDVLDRGPGSRAVLDLLMRLQREAETAGGRLHVLLGNHEVMNLQGDWRYVTPADYAAFAADESDAQRAAAYAALAATAAGGDAAAARARFDAGYPRGFFARQAAFAPTGAYGAWLLSLPAIVVINDTAYVHGGLPKLVAADADGLNEHVHATLARYFVLRNSLAARGALSPVDPRRDIESARAVPPTADAALRAERDEFLALANAPELGLEGPLWYRGSVYCKPLLEEPTLDAGLAALGAARVVVGHTPTPDRRARALYGGKLVTLDTGMLAERYGGRPAALLVDGARLEVAYAAPPERSPLVSGRAAAFARTAEQLRAALEQGELADVEVGGSEPWPVAVRHDGAEIGAVFYARARTSELELAAAALDDLLGTDLVAPTVPRTIEGRDGALQLRPADAVSERERAERGLAFSGWCDIEPQAELMRAFDALILNRVRNSASVLFANDLSDLTLIDHGNAFAPQSSLPPGFETTARELPARLRDALLALDETDLHAALGEWLDARQIRALLARRDRLIMAP
jgi:hypothetical protein